MNEALRLLRRCLRPFGYDVRKKQEYNLLPIREMSAQPAVEQAFKPFDQSLPITSEDNLDTLCVVLRTCLKEERGLQRPTAVTGVSLIENCLRCLTSTLSSINEAHNAGIGTIRVIILDDHSDPEPLERIQKLCEILHCPWELKTTREQGQGASLIEQFEDARTCNELFYFCEDDYLHERSAIREMWAFYRQVHQANNIHMVIHPQEGESLFNNAFYPSYVLLGEERRWRTMSHATHVLFIHSHVVRDYWQYFENTRYVGDKKKRRLGSEGNTTNQLFDHIPGFAPIPALAGHMQSEHCLPPFFDWRRLWDENQIS